MLFNIWKCGALWMTAEIKGAIMKQGGGPIREVIVSWMSRVMASLDFSEFCVRVAIFLL